MASTLVARRLGRITFGGVLLGGLAYLLVHSNPGLLHLDRRPAPDVALVLTATWIAAFLANLLVRVIVTKLEVRDPIGRWFAPSVVLPAVAIALTLPISLHMPVALLVAGADGFDAWFQISVVITGAAHVVFAFMVAVRGYQLVEARPAWSPRLIYVLVIVTSCIPFVVLWTIPPVLVGITALPFLPMMRGMERMVEDERWEMQNTPEMLPVARVI